MAMFKGCCTGETTLPTPCPHCHRFVFNPPSWIRVVEGMFGLRKEFGSAVANTSSLARHLGVSRQRGEQLMKTAIAAGVIEPFIKFSGVFKPSRRGYIYYRAWRRAGWKGRRVKTQMKLRNGVINTGLKRGQNKISRKGGVSSEMAAALATLGRNVREVRTR